MPRTRGGSNCRAISSYPSQQRAVGVPIEVNFYACITKMKDMFRALEVRGIKIPNFVYDFSIPMSLHRLSNTSDNNFLLPFHVIKVGFHLPLHHFFCHLLEDYGIAPGQLSGFFWWIALGQLFGFSWWIGMAYFVNCCQRGTTTRCFFKTCTN